MSFCNAQGHVYVYAGELTEKQKQGLPCSCGQTFYHTKDEYTVEICPHCGQKIFKPNRAVASRATNVTHPLSGCKHDRGSGHSERPGLPPLTKNLL